MSSPNDEEARALAGIDAPLDRAMVHVPPHCSGTCTGDIDNGAQVPVSVDRGPAGIDGTIQVSPVATLANVSFVHPPVTVGGFQSWRHCLLSSGAYRCTHRHMVG